MKIVVLDGYTLNPGDLSWKDLEALGTVKIYDRTHPGEVVERATGAQIVLTNKTVLDGEALSQLPDLKYIGVLATGYNVVNLEAARRQGITVTNIPAYSTDSVAQMVFAHLLNITQRVGHYAEEVASGHWTKQADFSYWNTPLVELAGKTLGVIGLGHTGMATARIALAFGMQVLAYTSKSAAELPAGIRKADSLEQVFSDSNVVSLHCPLTETTKNLVNMERLKLMKREAVLINTGRGGLVNETDLAEALEKGLLAAAGVDVLSSEPPVPGHPLVGVKNCFITPHIAWATLEARQRLMGQAVRNIEAFLSGQPINTVIS
ncbi:D-2-hydroxyacid dehydrogenase [Phocaeicola barnesiae]|uniref:D-2-hydroxyacid dehydrogenase n=1 Tax=Phocaeicola barnesiae TaxID=376804 RepID=A0AAW5N1G6_9BACT|nr:D-2-hydroxyacid dehydrogenase [Phocaeicola barnesiae]MBS6468632.1 D-2-hydroxyacid dehydrogenase [Bacteroides sp.]MCF2576049.1 D-2-hydroxyacid dehydrogenase [Phocaeicola barnesiae]MCF2598914.1 D-2-hydroxyacid dehydrogenase [Phocaeicola barnesiae]MCR8874473.1 D-2-hydroxyacid dehydrogenase [Phocaeicola barnesiae]MDM8232935.1 D-2-hydroxyacid dehydrogenase [Phocaeicola barnesiae]